MSRMQTIQEDIEAVVPYSMHVCSPSFPTACHTWVHTVEGVDADNVTQVSSRYLDLTRQKLLLARLPRENGLLDTSQQWTLGTPKSVLEPLLDLWLEGYDWRAEEDKFNAALPQFRTLISFDAKTGNDEGERGGLVEVERKPVRTHFVHRRSEREGAVALLYCHSWPGSFVEVMRVVEELASPTRDGEMGFHVVCPSIPGFGFSDASEEPEFGVHGAAEVFAGLMRRLGYEKWVVCGSGWSVMSGIGGI